MILSHLERDSRLARSKSYAFLNFLSMENPLLFMKREHSSQERRYRVRPQWTKPVDVSESVLQDVGVLGYNIRSAILHGRSLP